MKHDDQVAVYDISNHIIPRFECFILDCLPACRSDNPCPSCMAKEVLSTFDLLDEFILHVIDFYELAKPIVAQPIMCLEIPPRAIRYLNSACIYTIEELLLFSEADLLSIPQIGKRLLFEIKLQLSHHGLALAN